MTYEVVVWNTFGFSNIFTPTEIAVVHPVYINRMSWARGRYRCLHADGLVAMANGTQCRVAAIKVGDEVMTLAEDNQMTKTRIELVTVDHVRESTVVTCVGSTWLTDGHPVCLDSFGMRVWQRPSELAPIFHMKTDTLYNFVVEGRSSIFVNDLEVCTLGQFCPGLDAVDSYFGSELVVQDSFQAFGGEKIGSILTVH
jgi:hypothetical protein